MFICNWCQSILVYKAGKGFIHPGGGLYVVRCDRCGWQSDMEEDQWLTRCPNCGEMVRDDHVALAVQPQHNGRAADS